MKERRNYETRNKKVERKGTMRGKDNKTKRGEDVEKDVQ